MTTEYPLAWPDHIERSKSREKGSFKTPLKTALGNVKTSVNLFARDSGKKLESLVISSNVTLGNEKPDDPGVAIWFTWDGMQLAIPVDRYASVEANLQAIYHVMEARRTELRHGTLALVRATFRGFLSLPAPSGKPKRAWWEVFGLSMNATKAEAISAFRDLAKKIHPDQGGNQEDMDELLKARDEAKEHFGYGKEIS